MNLGLITHQTIANLHFASHAATVVRTHITYLDSAIFKANYRY